MGRLTPWHHYSESAIGLAGVGVADRCGGAVDDLAALPIGKDGKEVLVAGTVPAVALRVIGEADGTEFAGTLVHAAGNQLQNEGDDSQEGVSYGQHQLH